MKKKILSVLCAAMMIVATLGMAGCGSDEITEDTNQTDTKPKAEVGERFKTDKYSYEIAENGIVFVEYLMPDEEEEPDALPVTAIEVPATIDGYTVTEIKTGAFKDLEDLQSVTIPNTVLRIQSKAFNGCENLKTVTLPDSLTALEKDAFIDVPGVMKTVNGINYVGAYAVGVEEGATFSDVTVEAGTVGLADDLLAFTSAKSVTLPASVKFIGNRAFTMCTALTTVTMAEGVATIGDNAFNGCTALASVTLPSTVTTIGTCAFYNCKALTAMALPEALTSIGDYAFGECVGLTAMTVPSKVVDVNDGLFYGCTALASVTLPEGLECIGEYAFGRCAALTTVTIPASVVTIAETAIDGETLTTIVGTADTRAETYAAAYDIAFQAK